MKGYILRDKEAEEEAKKARKAKNQGQWIRGRWERQACGGLKWIQDQPLKEELDLPWSVKFERFFGHARLPDADGTPS